MTQPLMIQVNNLSQRVSVGKEQLTILDGIRLQVKPGESVAIVGASGSGKSTLLGMLAGLDLPSEGEIYIAGQPLHQMDEEQRARLRAERIGFVFQSFLLIPELTALENVMLPAELRGISQAKQLATTLLNDVGLGERLHHKPARLSGGEQQRVALARAFICQPALLLADEPTGNLDQHTGQKVADLLFRMNRESGSSLVIVTHDVALAARCQRQLRMTAGRLEESR
ncbi:ABC transporter ATP-binding protein [Tolumonas osonensis]|uniref:Putative ABC transport system ATP-binding protein n=1 Tax=Tolumonas osonensis TaxID=675874 RepID=A0A841GRQ4_9GAMM|nr:ABC transporter ATP-binding protein [Tolumonas osonensis]MBB6056373.1 putative ABC transport system ATP-binding protein [Tolumonas osonensis]